MLPFCSRWLLIGFFILGGPNSKTAIAILNCLLARQYCFEDSSCSAILEIIPRVCGSEIVACSTVTVTKCQAALRTLQAFPFFKPTCLCREPHVDPDCNSFRDFLFDHPCVFVSKKEKDPYPVDALPSCNHALYVCQQEQKCIKIYDDFKSNCKVRDNKCRMDDRNICHDSWSNLRQTPMFGCICPNNHMKKRCDRIFSMVNHNPCVATMHPFYAQITNLLEQEPESAVPHNPYLFLLPPSLTHTTASDTPTQGTESTDNREYRLRYPKLDDTDASDNSSFDFGLGNIRNPLVDADSLTELLAHSDLDHDVSVNVLKNKGKAQTPITYPDEDFYPNNIMQQKYPSAPDHESNDLSKIIFQSTCHKVMESCLDNTVCRRSLSPILHHCDMSRCNRHSCMEALQAFYRKQNFHWNTDIAFCLCKKTDNKQDACLIAQEKLHPVCAQRVEGSPQPTCLSLAETCREDKECRGSLERYEQSCAVDSVTKKCAGSPRDCRNAMLGILGTNLRTSCACKGTDMTQLYDCMGWQRLLWVNPCVVESQKEFHTANMLEEARHTTSTPRTTTLRITTAPSIRTRPTPPPVHITVMTATEARENTIPELIPPPQPYIPTTTPSTTTISTTTTTRRTTTTKLTTTTLATTTIPPKFCLVKSTQFPDQQIKEGTLKRIYHAEVDHCSDICHCDVPEKLSCKTICIDRMPCQTDFAFYNHEAPAYQAFRGRCLCYSGRFICMKPSPGNYFLPPGIFLFLGYSEEDEHKLMKIQAKIVIEDVVKTLQKVIEEEAVNGTFCYLELYNITKENVIISGKVSEIDYVTMPIPEILAKEKDECSQWMEIVADKINSQNQEFMSHLLLSVFKMAEVEIIQIEEKSEAFSIRHTILSFVLPLVLLIIHFDKFMTSS